MKILPHLISLLPVLFLSVDTKGQTYNFSTYQEDYVSLGAGFPLTEGVWDDPNYIVPIGFEFVFFDDTITTLESSETYASGGVLADDFSGSFASVIGVYGPDIIDRGYEIGTSMSAIYFAYSGLPGQQVFTQEWLNVGFYSGELVDSIYVDYIHFQLRLYEATGDIVFHFGPSSIIHPELDYEGETGPSLGLVKNQDLQGGTSVEEVILLKGNPSNPTISNVFENVYLNGSIPENTVYRFSNSSTAVKDESNQHKNSFFYPNPTTGNLSIRPGLENEIIYPAFVFNSSGQMVKSVDDPVSLTMEDLPEGLYLLRFQISKGFETQRIAVLK